MINESELNVKIIREWMALIHNKSLIKNEMLSLDLYANDRNGVWSNDYWK